MVWTHFTGFIFLPLWNFPKPNSNRRQYLLEHMTKKVILSAMVFVVVLLNETLKKDHRCFGERKAHVCCAGTEIPLPFYMLGI